MFSAKKKSCFVKSINTLAKNILLKVNLAAVPGSQIRTLGKATQFIIN